MTSDHCTCSTSNKPSKPSGTRANNGLLAPTINRVADEESELYSRIPDSPTHVGWREVADAMESLVKALHERKAIPEVRLRLFNDPEYAETGKKSRLEVFESNGTSGNEIFRHPHFIAYLRHFIQGPDLPKPVIYGLCQIPNEDRGTSGMLMDQYRRYARKCVRKYGLCSSDAATEFFRLGVEIGMEIHDARTLRDAAKSTR